MNNDRFERSIKQLKNEWDKKDTTTSPDDIHQYVRLKKKRKRKLPFGVIAASLVLVMISSLLIHSFLFQSNQESAQDNQPIQQETKSETEPTVNGVDLQTTDLTDLEKPQVITEKRMFEGMEEEITYHYFTDHQLSFSTYKEEHLQHETVSSGEGDASLFFPVYGTEQNDKAYISVFVPADHNETTVAQLEESLISQKMKQQQNTIIDEQRFEAVDHQGSFQLYDGGLYIMHYAFIEHQQKIYQITAQYPIEWSEGKFPASISTFVNTIELN